MDSRTVKVTEMHGVTEDEGRGRDPSRGKSMAELSIKAR